MLEIGRKTKWMDLEYYTIPMTQLPMTDNGKMINFMAQALSIIKTVLNLLDLSITKIGPMLMTAGSSIRDYSKMI